MNRLSAEQHERIDNIAEQLIQFADEIKTARPMHSSLLSALGQTILNSCRPTQKTLRIEQPKKIDTAKIGSSIVFYLNQ